MSDRQPIPESAQEAANDDDAVVDPLKAPLGQTLYASEPLPTAPAPPPPLPAPRKRRRRGSS